MADQNDEVYLKQIFKPIFYFFGSMIELLYYVIQFFIKKIWIFIVLIVIGAVAGYFLDLNSGNEVYKQEIVIQPNSKSTSYIYNLIKSLPQRLNEKNDLYEMGLKSEWVENIKTIDIEPITSLEDIFDYLHEEYQDRNFQYSIQDFTEKELSRGKFIYLYKFYRIEIKFNKKDENNVRITKALLDHIYNNEYFNKQIKFDLEQASEGVKSYSSSIKFIDGYLQGVLKNPFSNKNGDNIVVAADKLESTMLAALVEQKNRTIYALKLDQEKLQKQNEVFTLVSDSDIIVRPKKLYKRTILVLPFVLCFLTSLGFFISYMYKKMVGFVGKDS